MESISCHITPLVINSLGADTHTHTHTHTNTHKDIHTETILRNQASVGLRPVHAWFKNISRHSKIHSKAGTILIDNCTKLFI